MGIFGCFRKFPTVEKRARQVAGDGYVGVLPDPQMARLLVQEVGYGPAGRKVHQWIHP